VRKRGFSSVTSILLTILGLALTTSLAKASSIVLDGDFLDPIGTVNNLTPWSDWTNAGITRHPVLMGIPGNYASMPVGADLFQQFSSLSDGEYVLSFMVRNSSPNSAQLVFGVQQAGGSPAEVVYADGLQEEITVPASGLFLTETLTFYVTPTVTFPVNELTFSNSYDDPVGPWANSVNPRGTVIDVADVSLTAVPEPSTWAMMLLGVAGLSFVGYLRRKKDSTFGIVAQTMKSVAVS
jgi:PEP-CTERM motif